MQVSKYNVEHPVIAVYLNEKEANTLMRVLSLFLADFSTAELFENNDAIFADALEGHLVGLGFFGGPDYDEDNEE